jgi:YD repeat-containing protein
VVKLGNPLTLTLPPDTRVIAYSYDGMLRLSGAIERPGSAYSYAYDAAGNRTIVNVNGQGTIFTYNAANEIANSGWTYDLAGNLLSDGTATSAYDALNRTTAVTAGSQTRTNTYNGDGVLVKQVANSVTTRYTQDLASPLSQILQAQGSTTTDYLYGLDRLAALNGGAKTWYLGDALDSVRRTLTDASAASAPLNYDLWGTPCPNAVRCQPCVVVLVRRQPNIPVRNFNVG